MQTSEASFKITIFGEGGVGKTSLTRRYLTGAFDMNTKMTLGASIFAKYLEVEGKQIVLQIWDFGGEESYRFLLPVYANGSSAGIFMYDISRFPTFKNLEDWLDIFREGLNIDEKDNPIFMVGGKLDLEDKRAVPIEDAKVLAESLNLFDYIECSAKSGENVEALFEKVARTVMKQAGLI